MRYLSIGQSPKLASEQILMKTERRKKKVMQRAIMATIAKWSRIALLAGYYCGQSSMLLVLMLFKSLKASLTEYIQKPKETSK